MRDRNRVFVPSQLGPQVEGADDIARHIEPGIHPPRQLIAQEVVKTVIAHALSLLARNGRTIRCRIQEHRLNLGAGVPGKSALEGQGCDALPRTLADPDLQATGCARARKCRREGGLHQLPR